MYRNDIWEYEFWGNKKIFEVVGIIMTLVVTINQSLLNVENKAPNYLCCSSTPDFKKVFECKLQVSE